MMISEVINVSIPQTMFGPGAVKKLGDVAKGFAPTRILIVTDPGLEKTDIIKTVSSQLEEAGFKPDVYNKCGIEAPVSAIEELASKVKNEKYDLLVGVGGGSNMDTTKAASIIAANDGITIQDLLEDKPVEKSLPKIVIPTTAGTGSEWSIVAVITNSDGRTYPYFTPKNYPDAVIIDPELTRNLPQKITADTGMDALTHAIEAYTSIKANIVSDMFSSYAIKLISGSIRQAFSKGSINIEDRYKMSIAASFAMLAGSVGGLGIAHFMNVALGKKAGITHGATVTLLLPYVMEFNMISNPGKYADIVRLMGENTIGLSDMEAARKSVEIVRSLSKDLGIPQKLSDVGITEADIPQLVEELMTYQTFPIGLQNPRDVSKEDAFKIYQNAL